MHNPKFQPSRVFVRNDLVERKIRSRRLSSKKFLEFKEKLALDPNKYNFDEKDIISALQVAFEGEIMHTQYCIKNKRLDHYFPEHKLAIETDEYGHIGRRREHEQSGQVMIEEKRGCKFIRINPDAAEFNINRAINQVYMHTKQLTIKSTKIC